MENTNKVQKLAIDKMVILTEVVVGGKKLDISVIKV